MASDVQQSEANILDALEPSSASSGIVTAPLQRAASHPQAIEHGETHAEKLYGAQLNSDSTAPQRPRPRPYNSADPPIPSLLDALVSAPFIPLVSQNPATDPAANTNVQPSHSSPSPATTSQVTLLGVEYPLSVLLTVQSFADAFHHRI